MHTIIEPYPEFYSDTNELITHCLVETIGVPFSTRKISNCEIQIISDKVIVVLLLDVNDRVYYYFVNPVSGIEYHDALLRIFLGMTHDKILAGGEFYPIEWDKWLEFYANDDFRSICRIDLPIIKDELIQVWRFILEGDFSIEQNYSKWEKWYEKSKFIEKDVSQLSFEHYLKEQDGIS